MKSFIILPCMLLIFSVLLHAQVTVLPQELRPGFEALSRKDFTVALTFFQKKAEEGNADAMLQLAYQYAKGEGTAKDSSLFVQWLNKAATAGNTLAMYDLGYMYDNGKFLAKDSVLALKWYRTGAEAGNTNCQNNLGVKYGKGRWVARDDQMALQWFEKSAKAGNAYGMQNLGEMYEYGRGVTRDHAAALALFRKAYAINGNIDAAYHIAINGFGMYYLGKLEKNFLVAQEWFRRADNAFAVQINRTINDTESMMGMANLYEHGYGVVKNNDQAKILYQRAADWGEEDAKLK